MITRHTLTLWVDVPDAPEGYGTDTPREIEKLVLAALRRFEYDVDLEHMATERVEE